MGSAPAAGPKSRDSGENLTHGAPIMFLFVRPTFLDTLATYRPRAFSTRTPSSPPPPTSHQNPRMTRARQKPSFKSSLTRFASPNAPPAQPPLTSYPPSARRSSPSFPVSSNPTPHSHHQLSSRPTSPCTATSSRLTDASSSASVPRSAPPAIARIYS